MSNEKPPMTQAEIFGDGLCVVCGKDVEPTFCAGKQVTLSWCSVECTRRYAMQWMSPKQAIFVEEYLVDLNVKQAAIRAGYSVRSAQQIGSENMLKPTVQQAISLAMIERSQRTGITVDRVLTDIETIKKDAMRLCAENQTMVNHASALKACELHGRHLKMFVDKVEIEVGDKLADRLQRAREREKSRV